MTNPLQTLEDHEVAIRHLEELMTKDPVAGSIEEEELQALAERIEGFEKRTFFLDLQLP